MRYLKSHHRKICCCALLMVTVIAGVYMLRRDGAFDVAESRSYPVGAAEETVALYSIRCFGDHTIFHRWGPHLRGDELRHFPEWRDADAVVRVIHSAPPEHIINPGKDDSIFVVKDGKATYVGANRHGDDWREAGRRGEMPFNPRMPARTQDKIKPAGH